MSFVVNPKAESRFLKLWGRRHGKMCRKAEFGTSRWLGAVFYAREFHTWPLGHVSQGSKNVILDEEMNSEEVGQELDSSNFGKWNFFLKAMVFKVWVSDWQYQHHLPPETDTLGLCLRNPCFNKASMWWSMLKFEKHCLKEQNRKDGKNRW